MSTTSENKTVYVDCGREVPTSKALAELEKQGVAIVMVNPWSPQNKGRAERAMRAAEIAALAQQGKV